MATGRIRVGVLGLTHDHIWSNLDHLVALDTAELVGAAEPDAALRKRFRQRYGDRVIAPEYDALLDGPHHLDAAFIFADNRTSAALGVRAAEANAPAYFLACIRADRPPEGLVSPGICRDAQEILDAAIQSIRTGRDVALPLDAHLPGIG